MRKRENHISPPGASAREEAIKLIPGFESLSVEFQRKVMINGYSRHTYNNYIRCIAMVSLGTGKLPTETTDEEIEKYLFEKSSNYNFSESYYKHTVWGLTMLFRMMNKSERVVKMPRIPKRYTLPIVLSRSECRRLFRTQGSLRNRLVILLAYSGGLRLGELTRLRWSDIDFSRKCILVRAGKTKRSRYVVLSRLITPLLRKLKKESIVSEYVFCNRETGNPLITSSLQFIIRSFARQSGIEKRVSGHILRHSFATHLLEDGVDLLSIMDQLGHTRIQNTMLYTRITKVPYKKIKSPLDTLYTKTKKGKESPYPFL